VKIHCRAGIRLPLISRRNRRAPDIGCRMTMCCPERQLVLSDISPCSFVEYRDAPRLKSLEFPSGSKRDLDLRPCFVGAVAIERKR